LLHGVSNRDYAQQHQCTENSEGKETTEVKEKVCIEAFKVAKEEEAKGPMKKMVALKKTQIPDDNVLSFEQKKDLSEAIQTLDGQTLEQVIQINVPSPRTAHIQI
jgi:hypothetical protein